MNSIVPINRSYPTLYKKDSTGKTRVWRMELGADEEPTNKYYHRTVTGVIDGAQVESGWYAVEPKNTGKANATTTREQAEKEIANEYDIKRKKWYVDSLEQIASPDVSAPTKPMLAQGWDDVKEKVAKLKGVHLFTQPKLDGMRCIARKDGLWTRTGKRIVSCPHIEEALKPLFAQSPTAVLDGELYNHEYRERFNDLMSILRKEKPTAEDLELSRDVAQYHVYDFVTEGSFSQRWLQLTLVMTALDTQDNPYIKGVGTWFVESLESLDGLYAKFLTDGYEGQMIRVDNKPYEHKRSSSLLKRKEFMTDEFPVVRMEAGEGNWAGAIKRFVIRLTDGTTCEATPRGSREALTALSHAGHCPKWATVRYFGVTPDGKLRFPIAVDYGFTEKRND